MPYPITFETPEQIFWGIFGLGVEVASLGMQIKEHTSGPCRLPNLPWSCEVLACF